MVSYKQVLVLFYYRFYITRSLLADNLLYRGIIYGSSSMGAEV